MITYNLKIKQDAIKKKNSNAIRTWKNKSRISVGDCLHYFIRNIPPLFH